MNNHRIFLIALGIGTLVITAGCGQDSAEEKADQQRAATAAKANQDALLSIERKVAAGVNGQPTTKAPIGGTQQTAASRANSASQDTPKQ